MQTHIEYTFFILFNKGLKVPLFNVFSEGLYPVAEKLSGTRRLQRRVPLNLVIFGIFKFQSFLRRNHSAALYLNIHARVFLLANNFLTCSSYLTSRSLLIKSSFNSLSIGITSLIPIFYHTLAINASNFYIHIFNQLCFARNT